MQHLWFNVLDALENAAAHIYGTNDVDFLLEGTSESDEWQGDVFVLCEQLLQDCMRAAEIVAAAALGGAPVRNKLRIFTRRINKLAYALDTHTCRRCLC
jgi:hypothetical protein